MPTNREDAEKLHSDLKQSGLSKDQMLLRAILGVMLDGPGPIEWPGDEDHLKEQFENGKTGGRLRAAKEIAEQYRAARLEPGPRNTSDIFMGAMHIWLLANGITEREL